MRSKPKDSDELLDWIDALENLILFNGKDDSKRIIREFTSYAKNKGLLDQSDLEFPFENIFETKDKVKDAEGLLELINNVN